MDSVALALWPAKVSKAPVVGRMGGLPRLASVADWPISEHNGRPLSFMFEVDLALLPMVDRPERHRFQKKGLVSFFAGLEFKYYAHETIGGKLDGFRLLYRADARLDSRPCEEPDGLPRLDNPDSVMMPSRTGWETVKHFTLLPEVPLRAAPVPVKDGRGDLTALCEDHAELVGRGRAPSADSGFEATRDWAIFQMLHSDGDFCNAEDDRVALWAANSDGVVFFSGDYPPVGNLGPNDPFVDVIVYPGGDGKIDWSTAKGVADAT